MASYSFVRLAALLLLGGSGLASIAVSPSAAAACAQGLETRVWTAPLNPQPGEPLEVIAVAANGALDELQVTAPSGRRSALRSLSRGGPPWSRYGTVFRAERGLYRIEAGQGGRITACTEVDVGGAGGDRGSGEWDLGTEALYSVWIEHLFSAPASQALGFDSLGPVLRDPTQNFLYGYLGASEDRRLVAQPDCADLAYYLRAYFAWKLGLPLSYRSCSRGSRSSPPSCQAPVIETRFIGTQAPLSVFQEVSRAIVNTVHSGNGRTGLSDESTDFYPVPLERDSLWPGTLYADPYGHTMILVQWVPQSGRQSGLLLAVDAQPDNSVTRKRYWEGNFLFSQTPSAGPGFKVFRPLVRSGGKGLRLASNAALDGRSGLPRFATEQGRLDPPDFYARMEQLINPNGLDPAVAYQTTLDALLEQLATRVTSVQNGEDYMRQAGGAVIPMPSGPSIFETTGPWEDYATPSRDMRVLIALKVLDETPDRILRYPELYRLGGEGPAEASARIARLHEQHLGDRAVSYRRSDGSAWELSLAEVYARRQALEVAYNPNDCVEIRWGSENGSAEASTCRRRAPGEQRSRMEQYRNWFRETTRPPR